MISNDQKSFADRMQEIVDLIGNSSELARRANVSRTAVEKWRKGMSEPSRENLIALANAASVSVLWLVTGQGEMLSPSKPDPRRRTRTGFEEPGPSRTYGDIHDNKETKPGTVLSGRKKGMVEQTPAFLARNIGADHSDFILIPRLSRALSENNDGLPKGEDAEDYLALRRDWARRTLKTNPINLALITASGDSMEPTIRPGDTLLVDTSATQFNNDAIYVLELNGAIFVKRVQLLFDKSVTIKSDNPAYREQILSTEDAQSVLIAGIVCWIGRPC